MWRKALANMVPLATSQCNAARLSIWEITLVSSSAGHPSLAKSWRDKAWGPQEKKPKNDQGDQNGTPQYDHFMALRKLWTFADISWLCENRSCHARGAKHSDPPDQQPDSESELS